MADNDTSTSKRRIDPWIAEQLASTREIRQQWLKDQNPATGRIRAGTFAPGRSKAAPGTPETDLTTRHYYAWVKADVDLRVAMLNRDDMEEKLERTVGAPRIEILGRRNVTHTAHTHAEIDRLVGSGYFKRRDGGAALHAELQSRQEKYEAAAEASNLPRLRADEARAVRHFYDSQERIFAGRAASPRGIACKLYVVLDRARPEEGFDHFPWPELQSAYEDLIDMANEQDAATYL